VLREPVRSARLEPTFRSHYTRLVVERIRRGDDAPNAVAAVEKGFCTLARHWAKVVAFERPEQWLETRLLSDPPITVPTALPSIPTGAAATPAGRRDDDNLKHRNSVTASSGDDDRPGYVGAISISWFRGEEARVPCGVF